MKILIVHDQYKFRGGEETYVESLIRLLSARGHTTIVYKKDNRGLSSFSKKAMAGLSLLWNIKVFFDLLILIRKNRPDVAHFNNIYPQIGLSAYWACRITGVKIVQSIHNYRIICPKGTLFRQGAHCLLCVRRNIATPAFLYSCYANSKMASFLFVAADYFHRTILKSYDLIDAYIIPNRYTSKMLSRRIERSKAHVIPYMFDAAGFIPKNRRKKAVYFLYLGRLTEEKGIMEIVDVVKGNRKINLKVIGDGPLLSKLQNIMKRHSNIAVLGQKGGNEVLQYVADSKCIVLNPKWIEIMPNVIIEALSLGTQVLLPRQPNFYQTFRKYPLVHFYDTLNEDVFLSILKNQDVLRGKETVMPNSFSLSAYYKRLMNVYEEILA